ncbi:MAG: hypothetical protein DHS20C01_37350 [marine bacterium B5-7]|nr:MAG: hypothetical protein DHS20C01_37350 [marine bacterium B5-7]
MSHENVQPQDSSPDIYLDSASFIDYDDKMVHDFAERESAGAENDLDAILRIYYAVRDKIHYDPFHVGPDPRYFRASDCLREQRGFCIPKAALMAACARALGVPARVGYADVKNHLTTPKLHELVGGNIYTWHSYTDVYLEGKWVKATPAFNLSLCEKFGVHPLDFNGRDDSLFQEFNTKGMRHMEYVRYRGVYADVPYDTIVSEFEHNHPRWLHNRANA